MFGNFLQVKAGEFHLCLERWREELGPAFRINLMGMTFVCVDDPEITHYVLKERPERFRRRRSLETVIKEMGFNGLFSSEGESWRRQRRIVAQALNSAHLHRFFPNLEVTTERFRKRLTNAHEANESLDLCRELMRYTVDVTALLAFGIDVNTIETDGPVIQQHLDKVFPMLNRRINMPIPYWRYFPLKADRELKAALKEVKRHVNQFIDDCRARMASNPDLFGSPTNFLEAVIAAQDEDGSRFSDEEIYANVITLLLAGEDTTAITLAWALKFFCDYPDFFKRARDEADAVLGEDFMPRNYDAIGSLPFIEAFANETMRVKPVAPLLAVDPNEDVELLGMNIPKGTPIMMLIRYGANSAENFSAPASFDPDRWLTAPGDLQKHNTKAFLPFGTGPRFCPGRNLALLEIKMVLAMICRNFDVRLDLPSAEVKEKLSFTMMPDRLTARISPRAL